jgi:hypothetical protein
LRSGTIYQLSLNPRVYKGLRELLEDADDVGVLRIETDRIIYSGDSVNISIPYSAIRSVKKHNVGWRAFWISGKRIKIILKDIDEYSGIELVERQSITIIQANKISKHVFSLISDHQNNWANTTQYCI